MGNISTETCTRHRLKSVTPKVWRIRLSSHMNKIYISFEPPKYLRMKKANGQKFGKEMRKDNSTRIFMIIIMIV